jgi:two-component system sensor histidine kinase KdpD
LRDVARQATSFHDAALVVVAIRLGGAPIGSLALAGGELTDTVLQSVANLAAIGLERARAQESTTRADAARESGELRAAVLDALAHEFKTPLTSMKVASGELQSSPSITAPRDLELLSILVEELERLNELVNDAVQMLRIDAGTFAVQRDRVRVADLVAGALRKQPRLQGRAVTTDVPEDLTVDADGGLLTLALHQLLDNAVKYSPPASSIGVAAAGNGVVDISVRNTGSPIPEREQARIFERFYRGAQTAQTPGTGMGLAIVRQIANAHGGTVSVSSPIDGPTAFTLSLPRTGGPR